MLTYGGTHVSKDFGAPSIRDIAVQSMRLVRFSGAAEIFWSVGMHCLLVADLMPKSLERPRLCAPAGGGIIIDPTYEPKVNPWLEVYALLHDAAEVCVADVPRPMKTAEARAIEDAVLARIYASLGVPAPTPEIIAAVKEADFRAALAEGTCGCSGRGFIETQTGYRYDEEAIRLLRDYLDQYQVMDALNPDGCWPLAYEKRLRLALRAAQHHVSYAPDREVDAPSVVPLRPPLQNVPTTPTSRILDAIEDLYAGLEHRPSCQMVKDTIVATINSGSRELAR